MIDQAAIARQLHELSVLARSGVQVGDLLEGLALILDGTHEPSPDGLRRIEA